MKELKSWVLVCALFVPALSAISAENIQGKVIFSVEVVSFGLVRDTPYGRSGIFYYYNDVGPGQYVLLDGYRFSDGKITDRASSGSEESRELVKKLMALPISSFNVGNELEAARLKMLTQTTKRYHISDGAEYRIRYDFNGVNIDYTGHEPGFYIDALAPYSENLKNLKELIDFFALSYGRRALF